MAVTTVVASSSATSGLAETALVHSSLHASLIQGGSSLVPSMFWDGLHGICQITSSDVKTKVPPSLGTHVNTTAYHPQTDRLAEQFNHEQVDLKELE